MKNFTLYLTDNREHVVHVNKDQDQFKFDNAKVREAIIHGPQRIVVEIEAADEDEAIRRAVYDFDGWEMIDIEEQTHG